MKVALFVFALVTLGHAVPSPRKAFHEHLDDFMDVIVEEHGVEYAHILEHYQEFEEFNIAVEYFRSNDFKDLVFEVEAIPEFKALVEFLEYDNIDISFIIDQFNEMLDLWSTPLSARGKVMTMITELRKQEYNVIRTKSARHELSGTDFAAFIADCMALLPKDKLGALYEQKREEFEDFRVAIDNLKSEEFHNILAPFWDSDVFQAALQTLTDNHIDTNAISQVWENTING